MSRSAADPMPQPPDPPGESECCESGCERCVWAVYEEARERYEAAYAAWRQRHAETWRDDQSGLA